MTGDDRKPVSSSQALRSAVAVAVGLVVAVALITLFLLAVIAGLHVVQWALGQ